MTQNVSVPEKTLEHWASLCVAYRYRSLAAQWWPVNGVDIDLQALPAQPGKAIQLELKTITPAGPGRHKVDVDLGQLWEYSHKPLARQPFYAFPRPHWDGELAAAARADGQDATELAVQRSKTGWWFGDWMVVMTTQQVVGVLRQDLKPTAGETGASRDAWSSSTSVIPARPSGAIPLPRYLLRRCSAGPSSGPSSMNAGGTSGRS